VLQPILLEGFHYSFLDFKPGEPDKAA
jgi:hypothetical protein